MRNNRIKVVLVAEISHTEYSRRKKTLEKAG